MYTVAADATSPGFAIHPDGVLYYAQGSEGRSVQLRGVDIGLGEGRSVAMSPTDNMGMPTVMPDGSVALPYVGNDGFRLPLVRPNGVDDRYYVIDQQ